MADKIFVGRESELETLEAHLKETLEGRGRVVFLVGEAGIGKSTLVQQFFKRTATRYPQVRCAMAECDRPIGDVDVGALSAYAPFKALIGELVGQEQERGEHWAMTYLREVGPSWLGIIPGVGDLVAALGDTAAFVWERRKDSDRIDGGNGQMTQEQIFQQAVNTFKNIAAKHNPLVLFVDDWHWADDSSTNLLFHLARQLTDSRILFLAAYRPHDVQTSREGRGHPIVQVHNELNRYSISYDLPMVFLNRQEVDAYLQAEFPRARFAPEVLDWLWDVSDGSPLFLTEYVRLLREDGVLTADGQLRGQMTEIRVPQGAHGVIEERLRRLSDELRRVLAYASAEGQNFTTLVLARLLQSDRLSLLEKLQVVEKAHDLIANIGTDTVRGEKTTRYAFTHTLVYRSLYESLNEEQREILHGMIVEWLGEEYAGAEQGEREPLATHLVAHAAEAHNYMQEARFALVAAGQTRASYAHDETLRQCELGLQALEKLTTPEPMADEMGVSLLLERGRTERYIGRWQEAQSTFEQAVERAEKLGKPELLAKALYYEGWVSHLLGDVERALMAYDQSLALFESVGDREGLATVYNNLGSIYDARGDYERALIWYEQSALLKEELNDYAGLATAYNNIGGIHDARGDYDAALEWYQKDLTLSEQLGNRAGLAATYNNIGQVYQARGDYEQAMQWYTQSIEIKEELNDLPGLATTYNNIGWLLYARGDYDAALEWYQQSAALFDELGDRAGLAATSNNIGTIHRARGDYDAALEWYRQDQAISEELGDREGLARTYNNIGGIHDARGEDDLALEWYRRSLDLFQELGSRAGLATALSNIGGVYHVRGDYDAALEWYERSRVVREELGDRSGLASTYNRIGGVHSMRGDYDAALEWYERSRAIRQELGDRPGLMALYNNIAALHHARGDNDTALSWYERSVALCETLGNRGRLAKALHNMATIVRDQGDLERALTMLTRSRDLSAELGLQEDAAALDELIAQVQQQQAGQGKA